MCRISSLTLKYLTYNVYIAQLQILCSNTDNYTKHLFIRQSSLKLMQIAIIIRKSLMYFVLYIFWTIFLWHRIFLIMLWFLRLWNWCQCDFLLTFNKSSFAKWKTWLTLDLAMDDSRINFYKQRIYTEKSTVENA